MARYTVRQLIPKYLRYRWQKRNYKFIHSQFVHELVQAVLASRATPSSWVKIKEYRKVLLADPRHFEYRDLGANKPRQPETITVRQFQKRLHRPVRDQKRLLRLVQWLQPARSLELGMATGVGTLTLAMARPNGYVHTLEGSETLIPLIEPVLKQRTSNITVHPGSFDKTLPTVLSEGGPFDCVLLDGNHTYEATMHNVHQLKHCLSDDGVLIVDDIRWSPGMEKAWQELITDPDFHVTIDLFRWGWIFKRPGQAKEHFVL